ncbi:MAG: hypothetical protein GX620_12180 [Chloroflexi bacterium]|nr:hypothetical protein [Chloroflexota bacterium]
MAFNRRLRMRNGRTYTHPGKGHPDLIEFAGPTDPEVGVIGAWNQDNSLVGCVVNYACHGTTGPGGISADWIYFMEQTIRGAWGDDVIIVFLNGACGDVTQVNNLSLDWADMGERSTRFVGTRVGAEVVKVLATVPTGEASPVTSCSRVLEIPRRRPSASRIQNSLDIVKRGQPGSTEWLFAKETLMLDALLESDPLVEVEVQAIQIGPAVLVANPAELFCQLGLDIKADSQFPFTYVVELANGKIGYVPTEEAFGPSGGGYETRLTSYSNLPVSAGASIVSTSKALIRSLQPGPAPAPPGTSAWTEEWDYGNAPPDLE